MNGAPHESLVQARAKFALEAVRRLDGSAKRELKSLPITLRTLGLLQAIALLAASSELRPLAERLGEWLLEKSPARTLAQTGQSGRIGLIESAVAADAASLRAAEHEAIELAVTMKLLAEALGEGRDG